MKIFYILIYLILFGLLSFGQIKNPDKPIRGEWDFNLKEAWVVSNAGHNLLAKVAGIVVNKDEKVFVWDNKQFKVFVYNKNGDFLYDFAKKGEGPGEVMDGGNTSMFLLKKYIILHEGNKGRINYFSFDGKYTQTRIISKHKYGNELKTYIDVNHFLFFSSEEENKKEDLLGIYNIITNNLKKITTLPKDDTFYIEKYNLTLHSPIALPTTLFAYDRGKIYFGRSDKYLINILDIEKNTTTSFSIIGREGNKFTKQSKMKNFSFLKSYLNKKHMKQLIKNCPDKLTYFTKIQVDINRLIYVFVPNVEKKKSYHMDIFSMDGRYLYKSIIKIPEKFNRISNLTICGNSIYCKAEDKSGEIKILKFFISVPQNKEIYKVNYVNE